MTQQTFRRLALGLQGTSEGAHMNHPDFRVAGRIFATLRADGRAGMVKLTPAQQSEFVRAYPQAFEPESGAWGRQGCTRVHLVQADEEVVGEALTLAWRNVATRRPRPTSAAARERRAKG
jgi:hypothetical protein